MFHKLIALFILGAIGIWLLLWNFIDFLTQGLNYSIWDWSIVISGFPSIATGFCLVVIASFLGWSVIKG